MKIALFVLHGCHIGYAILNFSACENYDDKLTNFNIIFPALIKLSLMTLLAQKLPLTAQVSLEQMLLVATGHISKLL